jgi:hypothetical protein
MNWRSGVTACLLSATAVTGLAAQEQVTVTGCPVSGIEMGCLVLKRNTVTYDISAAKPKPRVGYLAVQLRGTKSNKLGICQQGMILEDIQWSYTKEKCD